MFVEGKSRRVFFPSDTLIYGISRDSSKNYHIRTFEHMILGQLRMGAPQTNYAPLLGAVRGGGGGGGGGWSMKKIRTYVFYFPFSGSTGYQLNVAQPCPRKPYNKNFYRYYTLSFFIFPSPFFPLFPPSFPLFSFPSQCLVPSVPSVSLLPWLPFVEVTPSS